MTLPEALPYLIPPLVGALIGYVTNYVAIRMLFRPLKPWRLFGLRLPLTPGVIPARRGELAKRMGEMVGSHLLTTSDVVRALEGTSFRRELHAAIDDKLDAFLDRDLPAVRDLLPAPFAPRLDELSVSLASRLVRAGDELLADPALTATLQRFLLRQLDTLLERDLDSCLDAGQQQALLLHLNLWLRESLASPALQQAIGRFVDARSERLLRSEQPLRTLLPAELLETLLSQLEKEIPPLLDAFGGLLHDPQFRARLTESIRKGLRQFLDSLTGLTGLLSGFINLDQLDAKIPGVLDQVAAEAARWLREESTRRQVATLLRSRLEAFLERTPAGLVAALPYDKVDGVRRFLREQAVRALCSPRSAEALGRLAGEALQQVGNRPFSSLLGPLLPLSGRQHLSGLVCDTLLQQLRGPATADWATATLTAQLQALLRRPLGRLAEKLPTDARRELGEALCQQAEEVLRREVPVLLGALNVRQMVEDKVNQLDIIEVEALLLAVMKEQFTYINIFGALLGGGIGLLNLLLMRL